MGVFARRTVIDALWTELNIVKRQIAVGVIEHLTEAQVISLLVVQIDSGEYTSQVFHISSERIAVDRPIRIHTLHVATIVHGLVVSIVLVWVVGIGHPSDVVAWAILTQVNGDAARLIVQIDLHHTSFYTDGITKTYLIGSAGYRRQFHGHVIDTCDADGITLVRVPMELIAVHTDKSLR